MALGNLNVKLHNKQSKLKPRPQTQVQHLLETQNLFSSVPMSLFWDYCTEISCIGGHSLAIALANNYMPKGIVLLSCGQYFAAPTVSLLDHDLTLELILTLWAQRNDKSSNKLLELTLTLFHALRNIFMQNISRV